MIIKFNLKQIEKYNLTVSCGSFGKIKLIIRWNKIANRWVFGAELVDGTPLFYGQTMLLNVDLFKPYRNLGLPKGKLVLIDSLFNRGVFVEPTLENIKEFSLYYIEG